LSREQPGPDCVEIAFGGLYAVPPGGEVALEDYARALAGAKAAVAIAAADGRLRGVHLCKSGSPAAAVREDVEAFARELAGRPGDGLGWS